MLHPNLNVNEKGHLTIGGVDTVDIAKEYGTPAYVLDIDSVRAQMRTYYKALTECFGSTAIPLYASKALSFKGIYKVAAEEGLGIDCVSPGEIYTAHSAGFPMERAYFHGNNKTDADIAFAIKCGVGTFVVDNKDELYSLDRIAGDAGIIQRILLRITPEVDPHTHKAIMTGNVDSKFGSPISTGQAEEIVLRAIECKNIELVGVHAHIGSQIFDTEPFVTAAEIMIRFIADIYESHSYLLRELNLGGGFGVRYTENDEQIDVVGNIKAIAEQIDRICRERNIIKPKIMFEPGRSIVAAAGLTLYTVGSVKTVPGFRNYVSVDGGMPDNPRYALYGSKYTALIANKASAPADYPCTLAGRCCESGDLIGEDMKIQTPERSDTLAVLVTGAYNYSMASNYNRIPRPPIVAVEGGVCKVAVERETYEHICSLDT